MNKEFKNCYNCKNHFLSFIKTDKCLKSKIDLGHTTIYKNCDTLRSQSGPCGTIGQWFEGK